MEPWQLGATEIIELIDARVLSPVELTESLLGRIASLDGEIEAWVTVDGEAALASARALADRLSAGDEVGSLAGVPVGLKDVIYTKGLRTTASSKVLADFVPEDDAHCVELLRSAGATILGKLHTAEFACADPAPTRNPWNLSHTPGGSSAGSGAAVAYGGVPLALGTQTGGSTLRPAAYNGIVGMKPTYGMISNRNVIPVSWSFDHVGILARSVADASLALGAIAGYDPADPSSSRNADEFVVPTGNLDRPPVIGLVQSFFLERCEPEMYANTMEMVARFEAEGAQIREVLLPESFSEMLSVYTPIFRAEMNAYHRDQFARFKDLYGPKNRVTIEDGATISGPDLVEALRRRPVLVADLEAAIAGVDVALTPATPAVAPRNRTNTGDASFQTPWSFVGAPAMALPSGVNPWGLPIGIQLVGHRWRDADLLRAATWCERIIGFAAHPPSWGGREVGDPARLGSDGTKRPAVAVSATGR
jgi:aspartyl-tRNA(Asn)/glutamyl-tRNA(Gln) amidotransferase subunit A